MSQHSSIHTALQRIRGEERGEMGRGGGGGECGGGGVRGGGGSYQQPGVKKGERGWREGVSVTCELWYYVGAQQCYILIAINKCQRIHEATM